MKRLLTLLLCFALALPVLAQEEIDVGNLDNKEIIVPQLSDSQDFDLMPYKVVNTDLRAISYNPDPYFFDHYSENDISDLKDAMISIQSNIMNDMAEYLELLTSEQYQNFPQDQRNLLQQEIKLYLKLYKLE